MKTDHTTTKQTIGGHAALDLMNTVWLQGGQPLDHLDSDQSVLVWLADYVTVDTSRLQFAPGALLAKTRELRETVRALVSDKKAGRPVATESLNHWLAHGDSHLELVRNAEGQLYLERRRPVDSVEQLLAPIAEAAAELLTLQDFSIIRKCESTECVLWFYDRTKGHKRRWCSMAVCGNRHKVSSFRKRQSA